MFQSGSIRGPATATEIDTFLSEWRPSANRDAPTGWIWCLSPKEEQDESREPVEHSEEGHAAFETEGRKLVEQLVDECREIKATAPVRAKKGVKSQKQLRAEAHARFNDDVKRLAQEHGVLTGKWLFFPGPDTVDAIWSKIVRALADRDGALAKTGVVTAAKVAPIPSEEGGPQVICVYAADSWNREAVGKAFKALVEGLELVSTSYKCDAFTILGIDSKHESGIKSSLWSKGDFMSPAEIAAVFEKKAPKPKEVKKKTIEEERAAGLDDFDPVSSDDDEPKPKKRRT
ncbi:hypothetical protein JCM10212_002722 [Sporobolomyces blumeae]